MNNLNFLNKIFRRINNHQINVIIHKREKIQSKWRKGYTKRDHQMLMSINLDSKLGGNGEQFRDQGPGSRLCRHFIRRFRQN